MIFGSFRCVQCKEKQECDMYPYVGRIFECQLCGSMNFIAGHYIGFGNTMHMRVFKLPPHIVKKAKWLHQLDRIISNLQTKA